MPITKSVILNSVKTDDQTGCWNWQRTLNDRGYGVLYIRGKQVRAHRIAYQLFVGEIPEKMMCCHRCDNPKCCNPLHMFLGTQKENILDMWAKGRASWQTGTRKPLYGEDHPSAKLTKKLVLEMRRTREQESLSITEVSVKFGITRGLAANALNKKKWSV